MSLQRRFIALTHRWHPALLQERLDVAAAKTLDPPYQVAGKLFARDHPVNGHLGKLKESGDLGYGVEFRSNFTLFSIPPFMSFQSSKPGVRKL